MKTIKITAEEMLIDNTGFYIVGCDGQDYEIKRCFVVNAIMKKEVNDGRYVYY